MRLMSSAGVIVAVNGAWEAFSRVMPSRREFEPTPFKAAPAESAAPNSPPTWRASAIARAGWLRRAWWRLNTIVITPTATANST